MNIVLKLAHTICNFLNCTIETIRRALIILRPDRGGSEGSRLVLKGTRRDLIEKMVKLYERVLMRGGWVTLEGSM